MPKFDRLKRWNNERGKNRKAKEETLLPRGENIKPVFARLGPLREPNSDAVYCADAEDRGALRALMSRVSFYLPCQSIGRSVFSGRNRYRRNGFPSLRRQGPCCHTAFSKPLRTCSVFWFFRRAGQTRWEPGPPLSAYETKREKGHLG